MRNPRARRRTAITLIAEEIGLSRASDCPDDPGRGDGHDAMILFVGNVERAVRPERECIWTAESGAGRGPAIPRMSWSTIVRTCDGYNRTVRAQFPDPVLERI